MTNIVLTQSEVDVPLIYTASRVLQEQGIRHVLIGSAGLWMYDKLPKHKRPYDKRPFKVSDIDFLVSRAPYVKDPLPKEQCSESDSVAVMMNGIKVDYVVTNFWSNNKRMCKYFTKNPEIRQGIPVAALSDILGLKLGACREKDFNFLSSWVAQYGPIPQTSFWQKVRNSL